MRTAWRLAPVSASSAEHVHTLLAAVLLALAAVGGTLACGGDEAPIPPRNLVLISVDTLRADHLGDYGSTRGLTPNIDALARESVRFQHAFSPAPFTLASVASMLTGRYPEEVGVEWNRSVLAPKIPSLAQLLKAQGWQTAAVVSNFVLRGGKSGIHAGFEHYDDVFTQLEATRGVPERIAADTTRGALRALEKLETRDAPFFLWVHYQDPHGPYTPGEELRQRYFDASRAARDTRSELPVSPGAREIGKLPSYQFVEGRKDPEFYRAGYEGEIHLLDRGVGALLDALRERGVLDDAVVVFTADHGESLGESDFWFAHGELLSDSLVRIPLLFRLPGIEAGARSDPASLVDLLPTTTALLGLPPPPRTSGRDLFAPGAEQANPTLYLTNLREASRPRFGIVSDGYKYVVTPRLPGARAGAGPHSERLASLSAGDQPLEKKHPKLARELRRKLFALHRGFEKPEAVADAQKLSPEEQRQLEALGYIDPEAE